MNRILMVCLAVGAWLVAATFLYAQSWGGGVGPSTRCVTESYETHYSTAGPALDRDLSRLDAGVEGGLRGDRSLGDAVDLVSVPPARVELRLERQRHGDQRPLPHAAGKLVRIVVHPLLGGGDAGERQKLDGPLHRLPSRRAAMDHHDLGDLVADGGAGIERRQRVLADEGDALPEQAPPRSRRHRRDTLAVQQKVAAHARMTGQQAHDRLGGGGLAGARLADDGEHLAPGDVEGQVAHDVHVPRPGPERHAQVPHGKGGCMRGGVRAGRHCRTSLNSERARFSPKFAVQSRVFEKP